MVTHLWRNAFWFNILYVALFMKTVCFIISQMTIFFGSNGKNSWAICKPRHWNWNWKWYYKRHYFQFHKDLTHNVKWLFDIVVTSEIKNVISPLSQGLYTPDLAGWWFRMREPHQQSHETTQRRYISTFIRPMDPKLSRILVILWLLR